MANKEILKQKSDEVNALSEKIKKAKVVLLTDYRGINVSDVTDLRTKLRQQNTEYAVIKNNITRRAFEQCGISGLEENSLIGPTALIIGYEDYLGTAKTVYEYAKANDFYKIKGGIIEGKAVLAEEIITLAQLPSRETLIAQLAGALLGNITKLAVGLNEVVKVKEKTA